MDHHQQLEVDMATYYLIRGDQIIATIETAAGLVCMPILGGGDAMSLLNQQHAQNLMANLDLSAAEALAALGVANLLDSTLKTVFVAPNPVGIDVQGITAYHLIDVGTRALWQCDGQQDDLLALHDELYEMSPEDTLGMLAVVNEFGTSFYQSAVRTATGMTVQQALVRRDRIADYLESLDYDNTDNLRAATNEHDQMLGIVTALEHTEAQLWAAMVE
jgi:hypothetical protein